jgi:hypothetical protein
LPTDGLTTTTLALQGVDVTNDMLVFACAGLTAAAPKLDTSHSEHKHHHRSLKGLLPAANAEIASGWLVSDREAAATATIDDHPAQ